MNQESVNLFTISFNRHTAVTLGSYLSRHVLDTITKLKFTISRLKHSVSKKTIEGFKTFFDYFNISHKFN